MAGERSTHSYTPGKTVADVAVAKDTPCNDEEGRVYKPILVMMSQVARGIPLTGQSRSV